MRSLCKSIFKNKLPIFGQRPTLLQIWISSLPVSHPVSQRLWSTEMHNLERVLWEVSFNDWRQVLEQGDHAVHSPYVPLQGLMAQTSNRVLIASRQKLSLVFLSTQHSLDITNLVPSPQFTEQSPSWKSVHSGNKSIYRFKLKNH